MSEGITLLVTQRCSRALRALTLPLLCAVAALVPLLLPAAASAASVAVTPTATTVAPAPDYASEGFADPWDFANAEDFNVTPGVASVGITGLTMANGALSGTYTPGGNLNFVHGYAGALPWGRDSQLHPINASRYDHLSFLMYSSASAAGGVFWFSCLQQVPSCQGALPVAIQQGWHVYDIDLRQPSPFGSAAPVPWSGTLYGLRLDPGGSTTSNFVLEWVRLHGSQNPLPVNVAGDGTTSPVTVYWDADSTMSNNVSTNSQWGVVGTVNARPTGSVSFDAGAFPPGSYRFYAVQNGVTSAYSAPVTIAAPPLPQILSPNVSGGSDYAAAVRHDAWDFSQASDVSALVNATGSVANGLLSATNAAPNPGDSQVYLPLNGPIDGSRYHHLTLRIRLDGPFGLSGAPGGGMVARVVYRVGTTWQDSNDLVVYPGWNTVAVDLKTNPPSAVNDEADNPKLGWAGQQINMLRIDPNEDPGYRGWAIDSVTIADDNEGAGAYDISYRDNAWQPGTTADFYAYANVPGGTPIPIASGVPVNQGVNTFHWALGGLAPGTYYVSVNMHHGAVTGSAVSSGPVRMDPLPGYSPIGNLDSVSAAPGGVRVNGWTFDPDAPTSALAVRAYYDGPNYLGQLTANLSRPDIGAAYPAAGSAHGYSGVVPLPAGTHQVCLYAINVGGGGNSTLGCRTVTRSATPVGNLDSVRMAPGGVTVSGWALDPDTAAPILVRAYVDGPTYLGGQTADLSRPDIGAAYPAWSANHGYAFTVPLGPGTHTVCAYGIGVGAGGNGTLGCRTITVPANPLGSFDGLTRSGGTVTVSGWALDPQTNNPITVRMYLDAATYLGDLTANLSRPDVAASFPGFSAAHGFRGSVSVPTGHQLCIYALNVGAGTNVLLACRPT